MSIELSNIDKIHGLRILVKIKAEAQTASGIMLPINNDKPTIGEVMVIGNGEYKDGKHYPVENLNIGDVVYFAKYGATEVTKELYIINVKDIYATLKNLIHNK